MILIDFSNLIHNTVHSHFGYTKETITEDLLRHVILNNIFNIRNKINNKSLEVVLCCDGKNYWRRDIYPEYKQNRKLKPKDPNGINWDEFYSTFDKVKESFKSDLPYKLIEVERCEADDIIAALALQIPENHIIISTDKDFIQLQDYKDSIRQWNQLESKYLSKKDYGSLLEKVIRGDSGDGICNILSDTDTFLVETKRQKAIKQKWIDEISTNPNAYFEPETFCDSEFMLERFKQNKIAIDLRETPKELVENIINTYNSFIGFEFKKRTWFKFCMKYQLNKLLETTPWI